MPSEAKSITSASPSLAVSLLGLPSEPVPSERETSAQARQEADVETLAVSQSCTFLGSPNIQRASSASDPSTSKSRKVCFTTSRMLPNAAPAVSLKPRAQEPRLRARRVARVAALLKTESDVDSSTKAITNGNEKKVNQWMSISGVDEQA